jgi:diguanylate cyclase (GGDEF)-like protein/PAS domain S-box-containing protein
MLRFPEAPRRVPSSSQDVEERLRAALDDLRGSEARYALVAAGASDGLWDWSLATNVVRWSDRWKALLGYPPHAIAGEPDEWFGRVHPDDRDDLHESWTAFLAGDVDLFEHEHRVRHADGTFRWMRCRAAATRDVDGRALRAAGSLTDVTQTTVTDPLTGLPNRTHFEALVSRSLERSRRGHDLFAVLVIGLDRFDAVNGSLGRSIADRLLMAVTRRLQSSLRSNDAVSRTKSGFTLARAGGGDFTVLLDDISDPSDALRVADRLRSVLQRPFEVDGRMMFASASVGIAVSSTGYDEPDAILRDATTALRQAKAGGAARCQMFDAVARESADARLRVEHELQHAIESTAFVVHYQPVICLATGAIVSVEALVRWEHPERGLLAPAEFLGVAEATGAILPIGRFVLGDACRQVAAWQQRLAERAPRVLRVNLSPRQLADDQLTSLVRATLRQTGLAAASLAIEVTEHAFTRDALCAKRSMLHVHSDGVDWSLDDFGTGYSSLSRLHELQIGSVKVDRALVARVPGDDKARDLVRVIVDLAHSLGMTVVAEGVETVEQVAELRAVGCDHAQGHYFSPAVDALAAERLIEAQPWRADPAIPGDRSRTALRAS